MEHDALAPAIEALFLLVETMVSPLVLALVLALRLATRSPPLLLGGGAAIAFLHAAPKLMQSEAVVEWSMAIAANLVGVGMLIVAVGWCIAGWLALRRMVGSLLGRTG